MISISKDLLNKIFETKKFEKEYKYDVASYIDIKLKQFPANLTQKELEEKTERFCTSIFIQVRLGRSTTILLG